MAFLATTTPPTGIVPAGPVGQASGITAPFTTVGVFINTFMELTTDSTFVSSNSFSAFMLMLKST